MKLRSRPVAAWRRRGRPVARRMREATRAASRDALDTVLRRRGPLDPPRRYVRMVGSSDPNRGRDLAKLLVEGTGLASDDRVLDIGCGFGRVAIPLIEVLGERGSYEGFDIVPGMVRWARAHITADHPNFRFTLADIHNGRYHRRGRGRDDTYGFPYPDASFDVALATSVFTHLLPAGTENYLRETARVLRPGGRFLMTVFLYDPDGELPPEGRPRFVHRIDGARVADPTRPERALALPEPWLRERVAGAGLRVVEPVRRGSWRSGDRLGLVQDVLVVERPAGSVPPAGRVPARA